MYYHGLESFGSQLSRVAVSADGIHFEAQGELLGPSYFRVFKHGDRWYSLVGSGELGETDDLHKPFRPVADIIGDDVVEALYPRDLKGPRLPVKGKERFSIRHVGTDVEGNRLIA